MSSRGRTATSLITRSCVRPKDTWCCHRTKVGRGALGEIETAGLAVYQRPLQVGVTLGMLHRNVVAERHIVIGYAKRHLQHLLLVISEHGCQFVGLIVAVAGLGLLHVVVRRHLCRLCVGQRQSLRQVADARPQAQCRLAEHRLPVECDSIRSPAVVVAHRHLQCAIGRLHRDILGLAQDCGRQHHKKNALSHRYDYSAG